MSFHEFLHIIIINKKSIIKYTLAFMVLLFVVLYLIAPRTYRSVVTILPPEKNKELSGLGSLLAGQDLSGLLTGSAGSANSQLFIEMLKSRTASEFVINKHNLLDYLDAKSSLEAAEKINEKLNIELTKEGIIKLSVEVKSSYLPLLTDDQDSLKNFAANLSNSYVEALDVINRAKLSSKAKRARLYVEQQLVRTRSQLDSAETALMEFQKVNKAISLPEQVQAAIEAAAGLKTEIVKTEIELNMLGSNLREDNKSLVVLREKLNELRNQYNKLEMGNQDYLVAFNEVPSLGRHLASLIREVKIQNEVYLLLQQQYYKEKIQETRDIPTVDVLDQAVPPLKASGPRVIFSTVAGGVFMFLLMILISVNNEKKIIRFRMKNG